MFLSFYHMCAMVLAGYVVLELVHKAVCAFLAREVNDE